MEKISVFTYRLDMALRLVDTTSGRNIPANEIKVFIGNNRVHFEAKSDNILIFRNLESRAFQMEVISPYFEPVKIDIDLDTLNKSLPLVELHMVPNENYRGPVKFFELSGTLKGISSLSAVRMEDNSCLIREFDSRKRIAKIFNPHRLALDRVWYAMVDPDVNTYETFKINKLLDDQTIKIDRVLETEFKNYFQITPLISGITHDDGSYCLRVRDEAEKAKWLVRWYEKDKPCFRVIDFRENESPSLEGGGG